MKSLANQFETLTSFLAINSTLIVYNNISASLTTMPLLSIQSDVLTGKITNWFSNFIDVWSKDSLLVAAH